MHKAVYLGFFIRSWVRISFTVALLSILLSSWFMSIDREAESTALHKTEKDPLQKEDVFPKLTRLDPVKVGHIRELNLLPGKVHKMKTLSLRPALFEIEDFLTEKECNDIILMAQTVGLERSKTLGEQKFDDKSSGDGHTNNESLLQDHAEIFKILDSNGDERLDVTEVAGGLLELGRVLMNEDDAKKLMSDLDMDPNKDGVITYDEFPVLNTETKVNEIKEYLENIHKTNANKRTRDSSTAFLDPYEHIDFRPLFESLRDRIHVATQLPKDMIWSSENMQVIKYEEKQHYHCHFDSEDEDEKDLPCCHHVETFYDGEDNIECIPCRFLTVFYYLNEPELGGETAFPIADNETIPVHKRSSITVTGELSKCNLAEHCYDSNLYFKPKRGTALLWYNHFVNNETGWLGPMDQASFHGGCNVLEGTKWAANNWINAGVDRDADLKIWKFARLLEEDYQENMKRESWEEQTNGIEGTTKEEKPSEKKTDENEAEGVIKRVEENKENRKEAFDIQASEKEQEQKTPMVPAQ